ncbi:MAG: glycosyltransferase family 39 protein [Sumerlaeia bacterium]
MFLHRSLLSNAESALSDSRRFRIVLLEVAALALLLRLIMVSVSPPLPCDCLVPLSDAGDYDHLARTMLSDFRYSAPSGEPTAFRPPVFPVFLAVLYAFFGAGNLLAVAVVQAFLGALNCALAGAVARAGGLSRGAAVLAAAGFALYPAFILQAAQILTEVLARTQLLLAVWVLLLAQNRRSLPLYGVAGGLMALAILNKSALGAAVPMLGLYVLWFGGADWKGRFSAAAAYALPAALILGGWTARNAVASEGRFIPISTNFPITFAQGLTQHSLYTNIWYGEERELLQVPDDYLKLTQLRAYAGIEDEMATGARWAAEAKAYIAADPGFFAILTVRKAAHFWSPIIRNALPQQIVAFLSMAPVLILGTWGLIAMLRRGGEARRLALLALLIGATVTLPYAISQPDVRYRLALVDPLWIVMTAGVVGAAGARRIAKREHQDSAMTLERLTP